MSLACPSYRTNAYAKGLNSHIARCSNPMNGRTVIYWDLGDSGRGNKGSEGSWGLSCNLNRDYSLSGWLWEVGDKMQLLGQGGEDVFVRDLVLYIIRSSRKPIGRVSYSGSILYFKIK